MSEQYSSLQTTLQRRQQQNFVGRERQMALFRDNLFLTLEDERRCFVFNIYGQGGVGKTSLLHQLFQLVKRLGFTPAWTDESQGNVLAVMVHLVEQIDPAHRLFKAFHHRYRVYQQILYELEADSQAPKGSLAALVSQTVIKSAIHYSKSLPIVGAVAGLVNDDELMKQIIGAMSYITHKLKKPEDRHLIQEPLAVLTPLFVAGLRKCANRGNTPLFFTRLSKRAKRTSSVPMLPFFFDTYERMGDYLDVWLRELLAGAYGDIPVNVVFIISGRNELDGDRWNPYRELVAPLNLEPFTDKETALYLSRKGIVDVRIVDVIFRLSGGLPLLVATLAAEHPDDPAQVGDPSGTAVDRFLKWVDDPARRSAVVHAALPRRLNRDVLREFVKDQDVNAFFLWLKDMPFIKEQDGSWWYHEVVRDLMLRKQQHESPQEWADIHGWLSNYYEKQIERIRITTIDISTDPSGQVFKVEKMYHRLCQAPQQEMQKTLDGFFIAFTIDEQFAVLWAEAVLQAGKDCGKSDVTHWGHLLIKSIKASIEKHYQETVEMLTQLLESNILNAQSCTVAFAWRGLMFLELGQHTQALEDMNASLTTSDLLTANDQLETPFLVGTSESLSAILWVVVLIFLLSLVASKAKGFTMPWPQGKQLETQPLGGAQKKELSQKDFSAEELHFDEETVTELRDYLTKLAKRKAIE